MPAPLDVVTPALSEAIARASYVSLPTVRTQIRGILVKLGVGSQLAAVGLAIERGWLDEVRARGARSS